MSISVRTEPSPSPASFSCSPDVGDVVGAICPPDAGWGLWWGLKGTQDSRCCCSWPSRGVLPGCAWRDRSGAGTVRSASSEALPVAYHTFQAR